MPKVSIIVPCYNVAPWLARCLDSLINQTLSDIEIICVDDKSNDDTLKILHDYAKQDKRINVIELKKNQGVSVARNTGIKIARGEYIGFVDPDDYVDLDFYEKLYKKAIITGADITVANIRETLFNGKQQSFDNWLKELNTNKLNFNYTLWCAIYKTSFIKNNKIYNPVGVITSQDTVFVIKCAVLANRIATVKNTFYNYIRVPDSLSSQYLSDIKVDSKIRAANLILDFLNKIKISGQDYCSAFYPMFEFICLSCIPRTTKKETQIHLARNAIDLFNHAKHKPLILAKSGNIAPYLICNDADGLYEFAKGMYRQRPEKIYVKLFNWIPIIRIKYYDNYKKISVCGIPVLGFHIKNYKKGDYNG